MFIDEAKIHVQSGKGGSGMVHFRREKYIPRGGPDGGDGGRGGDVVLVVNPRLSTLVAFRHERQFRAPNGENGGPNNCTGKSADALVLEVPPGTVVYDDQSGEVLGDLIEAGQQLIVCQGGRGGRGNTHFATSRRQTPRLAERGEPGEDRWLRLELKLIADIGIIGVPNAGKSTLLSVVTNARPKIAPYPFTTLEPNLGVADLEDEVSLVLADIPGLIEGAHQGQGLGDQFLRHIQRTRVLIHLLDGMAADPLLDLQQINTELALFDERLGQKPQVVALNKIDLPDVQARWPELRAALERRGYEVMSISAATGEGVRPLLFRAWQQLQALPPEEEPLAMPVYRPESDPRAFEILPEEDGWRVRGEAIERAAAMTYWEFPQAVQRFQRILEILGVDAALRKAGVQEGDTVWIGEFALTWEA
ncbi:MAG: GTPase ObgE [Anaerolineales bacterium]